MDRLVALALNLHVGELRLFADREAGRGIDLVGDAGRPLERLDHGRLGTVAHDDGVTDVDRRFLGAAVTKATWIGLSTFVPGATGRRRPSA